MARKKQNGRPLKLPLKYKTVKKLEETIEEYFNKRKKEKEPITLSGLALALGCDISTIKDYASAKEGDSRYTFSLPIKKAYLKIQDFAEKKLYSGQVVAGVIFALKNFGWSDKQEIDHTTKGDKIETVNWNIKSMRKK
jgi:hypothetical protein